MIRLDWRTLHAALATDLRLRLAAGLERDRMAATGACPWLLWSALAAALVGGVLYLLGGYHVGFHTLNHLAAGWPPGFWEWLTVLGDARLAIALALFFSLRHPRLFWALILAALVATAFTHGIKPWVAAWRPPAMLPLDSFHLIGPALRKSSFPSGHTVTAAVLLGVGLCFVKGVSARLLLVALAVTVGVSRVAVGVHWPLDVAAGSDGRLAVGLAGPLVVPALARGGGPSPGACGLRPGGGGRRLAADPDGRGLRGGAGAANRPGLRGPGLGFQPVPDRSAGEDFEKVRGGRGQQPRPPPNGPGDQKLPVAPAVRMESISPLTPMAIACSSAGREKALMIMSRLSIRSQLRLLLSSTRAMRQGM
jgi:membrane-associated phospholipid phosphatase